MHCGYVKTESGIYLVQIPDADSRWGFFLTDGDQSWDGGFGVASSWAPVPAHEVPQDVQRELDWIFAD